MRNIARPSRWPTATPAGTAHLADPAADDRRVARYDYAHVSRASVYEQALEPKKLVLIPGGHFDPYRDQFPVAEAAATQWFCEHLVGSDALHARLACLPHSSRRRLKLASGILRK